MGNVQSEATQEPETTKDGEEKANPDRSKPERGTSSTKREMGSQPPSPQTIDLKDTSQSRGNEPGGGDRQLGGAEMGKSNSKKSKLKLSSMWGAQNSSSGGIKETSLCNEGAGLERRCLGVPAMSRADRQSGQNPGALPPEEPKGLKLQAARPPQRVAHDPRALVTRKAVAKGKSKAENASPGLLLQPEQPTEVGPVIAADQEAAETKVCWTEHLKPTPKEYSEHEGQSPSSVPYPWKQPASLVHGPVPLSMNDDASGPPKFLSERNTNRLAPSCGAAPPGGKKVLLSWGSGPREKEQVGQRDSAPGSDGDSKGPTPASQPPAERATIAISPADKCPASGSDARAWGKNEAEAVSSETVQELLERGLNFLYKVTIQPGQWPPSVKAVKQKAGLVPPGVSYADVLKQGPQKKAPAGAPALHHITTAGRKLPSLKGLDKSSPEDLSSLSQLFLEHFKKVTPKEPTGHVPSPQVVTFLEELSAASPKRPEWQRPRPPTPYPQRRKGHGRKLPTFGAAVSQVVAFLSSDSKCDWLLHEESQMPPAEAALAGEEKGGDPLEPLHPGNRGAEEVRGSPVSLPACLLDEEIPMEFDENMPRSHRKLRGLPEGRTGTIQLKSPPCNSAQGIFPPPATVWASQTEDRPSMPAPKSPPSSKTPEVPGTTGSPPCAPVGPASEQKALAMAQARPKVRKQGPVAPKSKEKLKLPGQPKGKVSKGKGQAQWPRVTSPLRFEGVPLFVPFEKVVRPFYFGEPLEVPLSQDKPAATKADITTNRDVPEQDGEDCCSTERRRWPAFQVVNSCPRKCSCRHQEKRKPPKNVVAWLNPSANHLAEPPWVSTALLAASLVAGTKFCMDSYKQRHLSHED